MCNWCRFVVFRCESASAGGAIDEGMGRVASGVGRCALKKRLSCEDLGGRCSFLLVIVVSIDGRRMCQGGYWEVEAVRLVMLLVGGCN